MEKVTPERPTDPTVDDTDDDGLPDGYEYYIWYHAYVGWMEDGKLKRLEGSKFQLEDIAVGKKITPEDITKAFNPNAYASNIDERDEFRKFSFVSLYAEKVIIGHGLNGYLEAIDHFANR